MKNLIFSLLLIFIAVVAYALPPLPSCYHTYAEITTELFQIQDQYPNLARVYNIGHSELDSLPIYAMKISDNVNVDEQEPAVVLVGQVHAEEVLGVETTMSNIHQILENSDSMPYGNWIAQLEMWFIPTLNPEGHTVVTEDLDPSYRKNKHDNNNNGIFDFSTLIGYDIDGVDINRNFAFNWCHGDTLFTPSGLDTEAYDYYRGPAPMSESEVQGFADFCYAQKPVSCIIWHSSRSGNLSEKVFYPVNYYGVRPSPDLALAQQIGEGVAAHIIKEDGSGGYEPSASEGRKGGVNDWMYQQFGTICLVIECGTSNLQPDSTLMVDTIERCSEGVWWLLNRALPLSSAVPSSSMLTGNIKDAVTQDPLEAEIIVEQKKAPWFAPRKSDPSTGRYFRPVSNGSYTLRYRKKGYEDYVLANQPVNNGSWTTVNANLQPLTPVTLQGTVRNVDNGNLIPAKVKLYDVENDELDTNGEFMIDTFEGTHHLEVDAEGFYPLIQDLEIPSGISTLNINVVLSPATEVFTEDWENGLSNWVKSGPWVTENVLSADGYALTDSWGGKGFYAQNCNVWIRTPNPVYIPASSNALLRFDENLYTEFVYDSVRVEVSADTLNWQTIYSNSGQYDWWHPVYVNLGLVAGQNVYLRFRLTDHSTDIDLTDPGWTIDNVKIITGSATPAIDTTQNETPFTVLYPPYPNPFGPETNIKFSMGADSEVRIDIYNLKGQKVKTLARQAFGKGYNLLRWNGTDDNNKPVGSGIYFCRLSSNGKTRTAKLMLIK